MKPTSTSRVLLLSLPGFATTLVTSMVLHPLLYGRRSSLFARLRGGPSIGIALIGVSFLFKRESLRTVDDVGETETMGDLLALLWATVEVASATMLADVYRSAAHVRND